MKILLIVGLLFSLTACEDPVERDACGIDKNMKHICLTIPKKKPFEGDEMLHGCTFIGGKIDKCYKGNAIDDLRAINPTT